MKTEPEPNLGSGLHYEIDAGAAPAQAWRAVAAHHLLTSRHLPGATMSISGIDDLAARQLRIYATELGLAGLRIPDAEPSGAVVAVALGASPSQLHREIGPTPVVVSSKIPPSVLSEALNILLGDGSPSK